MELNYHHLRYFHVVAHEGHLTRAARRLNVSQSALSAQIRQLEDRLGEPLFERQGRTLQITEAGRIALRHADAIFSAGEELVATMRRRERAPNLLRIGALSTLSRNFQLAFLRPVLGREGVEVVLRSGGGEELFSALRELELDLVLTNQAPSADSGRPLIVHRIDEQAISLVGVPGLAPPDADTGSLLAQSRLILPSRSSGIRAEFEAHAARLQLRPNVVAEIDDMAMMRLLAREGVGIALIAPIVVTDELRSGQLVEYGRLPDLRETFFAVRPETRFPNPLLDALVPARKPERVPAGG